MTENEISYAIIGIAMELHKNIGAGLLESAYENALVYDLRENGFEVKQQLAMPFIYKEVKQDIGYRIDILVENKVLIEIKSVENLAPVHFSQTLTYLKLSGIKFDWIRKRPEYLLQNTLMKSNDSLSVFNQLINKNESRELLLYSSKLVSVRNFPNNYLENKNVIFTLNQSEKNISNIPIEQIKFRESQYFQNILKEIENDYIAI
jgi:GxxExxY protein